MQQQQELNIFVRDDIGQSDISAYMFGRMGYRTPNIDSASVAKARCSPTIKRNFKANPDTKYLSAMEA